MSDSQRSIPRGPRTSRGRAVAALLLVAAGAGVAAQRDGAAGTVGGMLLGLCGLLVGVAATMRDARRFEAEVLERANAAAAELEIRRRAETRLRAEVRAQEAARMESERRRRDAERSDRAKTAFLSNLSRELRTPLNNVVGLTGILLDTRLSDSQDDYVRTIHGAAEALITVVDDILDLSRLDEGDIDLDRREFELGYCVEGVVDACAGRAKELELELELDPTIPAWLVGDRRRLRQVLLALLGPACEHATEPVVRLAVRLERSDAQEVTLRFDIGCPNALGTLGVTGAACETQHDVPGTTVSVSTSLAQRIVQHMGGSLLIESGGARATFTVRLAASERGAGGDEAAASSLSGKRLLLIGGTGACAAAARGVGRDLGLEVDVAATGTEGLDLLKARAAEGAGHDVVVIDAELPDVAGGVLVGLLRGLPEGRSAGCILLRASGARERPDQLARMGFDAWMKNPISETRLRTAVLHVTADSVRADVVRSDRRARRRLPVDLPCIGADVLLAEDNLVNQRVTTLLLERLGCRVQIAATGMQAIERVMSRDFDLVLMDCLMPELNGFDATRAIRRLTDPIKGQIPIIALTASAEESDRESCLAAGMNAHLAKPVRVSDLARCLQHWTGKAGPQPKEPPMLDPSHPIDPDVLAALKELGGDDPGIFAELVDLFLSDTPERMRALEDAYAGGDVGEVEAVAHALKGSCGNLGAMRLYEMFRDIESCGRSGDVESVSSLIPRVRDEFCRVEEALRREVA